MGYLGVYSEEFQEYYESSLRIIVDNPILYKELKLLLKRVVYHPVDIDEYREFAGDVVDVIIQLISEKENKIFDLYLKFFDPEQLGEAGTFRFFCEELLNKIYQFRNYREQLREERWIPRLIINHQSLPFEGKRNPDIRGRLKVIKNNKISRGKTSDY